MHLSTRLVSFAAGVLLLARFAPIARACECTYTPTLAQEFASADVVFAGRVTATWDPAYGCSVGDDLVTTFTPTTRWKGALESSVQIHQDCSCANTSFRVGQDFIVFAWSFTQNGQRLLWTHMCALNTEYDPNIVAQMPPPLLPVPARTGTWGRIKTLYR